MTGAPHSATFSLEYDSEPHARTVADSLGQEVGEIDDDRSRTALERDGRTLSVRIEACDLVALRAAMNTWLSLADVAESTVRVGTRD